MLELFVYYVCMLKLIIQKSRDNILIIVEGQETEYTYFNALKQELKLSTTDRH